MDEPRQDSWLQRFAALVWILFCFEVGLFLIVFPWLPLWEKSYFSNLGFSMAGQAWEQLWDSPWFRGAVSGLGLVNVLISFAEAFRRRQEPEMAHETKVLQIDEHRG